MANGYKSYTASELPKAERALFEKLAAKWADIETLEPRNTDSLDFHEVGVYALTHMLKEAYEAGKHYDINA